MKLKTPIMIINFKAYREATGENAIKLAKICEKVSKKTKIMIAVAVQEADIYPVSHAVKIPVAAQAIDAIEYGAHTGSALPENLRSNGAVATLINHSEDRIPLGLIKQCIEKAKKARLETIVCADIPAMTERIATFSPDFIAIEPPELIGTKTSVSMAKPSVITKTLEKVQKIKKIPILCGAGIHEKADVAKAYKLGTKGILVASAVVLSKTPEKVLLDLAKGFKKK